MVVVGDLSGSGGAERYFSDLHQHFRRSGSVTSVLITAVSSLRRLKESGRVAVEQGIVALPLGETPAVSRASLLLTTVRLLWTTLGRGFDVVHICLPTTTYVPYAALLGMLPRPLRPAITLSVIDCTLAPNLEAPAVADLYERQVVSAHRMFARWTRLDGIFTWYQAFAEVARRIGMFSRSTTIVPAKYCFTDPARFQPARARDRVIVFAGRLSSQKRPLLFVDAIARLVAKEPSLVEGWRVEMYGKGPLEDEVRRRVAAHNLGPVLRLTHAADLSGVFARSRLFVSTQAIDNFTSLAMLEAMAAGNAVIAEDVGQTREFVRDRENGLLVKDATPDGFAAAIAQYLRNSSDHERMSAASRSIAVDVHTIEHAAADITAFWRTVAASAS